MLILREHQGTLTVTSAYRVQVVEGATWSQSLHSTVADLERGVPMHDHAPLNQHTLILMLMA
jgi:hypothetical protein